MRVKAFWIGVVGTLALLGTTLVAQPFPTPIQQAIALLTSGTTPFSIVGINASGYINWGTARSAAGYGFRDNAGVIEAKNSGGSWTPVGSGGGAPLNSTFITQVPDASLTNEQALSLLTSGVLKSATTTGVVSIAVPGSDYVIPAGNVATATALQTARSIQGVFFDGTANITLFDQSLNTTSSPTFNAITITNDFTVAGNLVGSGGTVQSNLTWQANAIGVAYGGTGLASGTSGGILGYTGATTLASSVLLTNHAIVLGAGAGATPTPLASLGTTTTVLHGNAAGAPTFGAVSLSTDVTGSLGVATGGTGIASYAIGDLLYASGSTTLAKLADVSAGSFLRSGGVTTAPAWSTTKWTNSATTGDVLYASGANTYANLADVAVGSFLRSGGVATIPVWSTTTIPNSATTGDLLYASATSVYSNLTAVATGRVLGSAGTGTAPAWLTNPTSTTFEVSTAFIGPGTEAAAGVLRLANTSTITARNNGNTGDITLLTSTSADHVVLGSANAVGLDAVLGTGTISWRATTPTISSGFGTTPSIAGVASAFKVTIGSGGDTTGVVLFATTWATAPSCTANNQTSAQLVRATPTTTQVTLAGTLAASDVISVLCQGY